MRPGESRPRTGRRLLDSWLLIAGRFAEVQTQVLVIAVYVFVIGPMGTAASLTRRDLLAKRGWTLAVVETTSGGMIGQRLTAVLASQFLGARVLPVEAVDLRNPARKGEELAQEARDEYSTTCALAVLPDPGAGATMAMFVHPGGCEEWTFGRPGQNEIMQARIATVSLEYIRRFLVGA